MSPWLLLALGAGSLTLTANAWRPPRAPSLLSVVSFFAGWLIGELALHHIAAQAILAAVLVWIGPATAWPSLLGLALLAVSWLSLFRFYLTGRSARTVMERALRTSLADEPPVGFLPLALPLPGRRDVESTWDIAFHRHGRLTLRLDVHRRRDRPSGCPTFVFVHGGAWMIGQRKKQGLPLLNLLASRGWVCFSVDYRLSPRATFPDHLVDVKHALAWVREHGAEYGADPSFIVLGGNSAGAHLASLAALTGNLPEYQAGFEDADTSVAGCVAIYGVYDFADRHRHWPHQGLLRLIERHVLKASRAERPDLFDEASPIARVHGTAPPFLIVHGDRDSLAPVEESRTFSAALAAAGVPVAYAEIPFAQHAFEVFPSLRAAHTVAGIARFAGDLRASLSAVAGSSARSSSAR